MAKKLSEQLANLSVLAKDAEDAVTAAEKEAHDKVVARKEQARVAASAAVEKVNQEIKSTNDTAARNWSAVKAKVAADVNALKANVAQAKHDLGAKRAENYAEELEWEAGVAIDYAIASIQQDRLSASDEGPPRPAFFYGIKQTTGWFIEKSRTEGCVANWT